ncbi:hypothetical protein LOK46_21940 [Methylobacterium sp. NMS14P]|uniref:hypothetical protein n=1 Tax=Methylobacterium sp. NMS14P TaxID=2894310 RepID=UPI0023595038|nr:hypothetical protein [Methylobacterium sp. NMS14P]WCS23797.1 hypothetical protein LOK46_21940 [Methylobacterium sp. NMS14P]
MNEEAAGIMTIARKLIYAASNGDRWFLCVGERPADVFVLHEPNGPSGGRPSRVELSTFLATGADHPERLALLNVIGSLVAASGAIVPASSSAPEPGAAGAEPTPGEMVSST